MSNILKAYANNEAKRLQISAKALTKNTDFNQRPVRLKMILFLIVLLSFAAHLAALATIEFRGLSIRRAPNMQE